MLGPTLESSRLPCSLLRLRRSPRHSPQPGSGRSMRLHLECELAGFTLRVPLVGDGADKGRRPRPAHSSASASSSGGASASKSTAQQHLLAGTGSPAEAAREILELQALLVGRHPAILRRLAAAGEPADAHFYTRCALQEQGRFVSGHQAARATICVQAFWVPSPEHGSGPASSLLPRQALWQAQGSAGRRIPLPCRRPRPARRWLIARRWDVERAAADIAAHAAWREEFMPPATCADVAALEAAAAAAAAGQPACCGSSGGGGGGGGSGAAGKRVFLQGLDRHGRAVVVVNAGKGVLVGSAGLHGPFLEPARPFPPKPACPPGLPTCCMRV